ncbi:hypothetical protein [Anaeromyxobacter diazotrophicus]|uniref:Uncharacterized protein n=1 Tax=Anaeromyxobacter diazotrophicus TaxID=2590199 RepID=A0A7I9VGG9_9BACT|nr:hypothetical protein [Anaeromyxobacter diazotrophicus]GEJ55494.1 hypothetical protein AMYX_02350 [Anaeromyxobacter diazotrophicus]
MKDISARPTADLLATAGQRAADLCRALSPDSSPRRSRDSEVDVAELAQEFLADARAAVARIESLLFDVRTE